MSSFYLFFVVSLILKLVFGYFLPLLPDETYYWVWSHNLQLSYFDHPAFIAWLIKLGHSFEPYGHSVRFVAILFGHCGYLVWREIFKELKISDHQFILWCLLSLASPFLGVGSIILTPDLPVMFFWSLCVLFFLKILSSDKAINYIFLGISLGLGFTAKYHIALFVILTAFHLTKSRSWNKISFKNSLLTILLGAIFSSPVLIWNYLNDFQSFKFQLNHGFHSESWKWQWPMEYVLGQILLLLPHFVYFVIKSKKAIPIESRAKNFIYDLTWGVFVFFLISSFKSSVEMNWTIIAYGCFYLLVVISDIPKPILKKTILGLFAFNIVVIGLMFNKIYIHGKIFEPFFFSSQKDASKTYAPLFGINYQTASALWYFSKIKTLKIPESSRFDFFDTLSDPDDIPSEFYVLKQEYNEYPSWLLEKNPKFSLIKKLEKDYIIEKVQVPKN